MPRPVIYKNICPRCGQEVRSIFCPKCKVRPVRKQIVVYRK